MFSKHILDELLEVLEYNTIEYNNFIFERGLYIKLVLN